MAVSKVEPPQLDSKTDIDTERNWEVLSTIIENAPDDNSLCHLASNGVKYLKKKMPP
jgi:hypothetical protein